MIFLINAVKEQTVMTNPDETLLPVKRSALPSVAGIFLILLPLLREAERYLASEIQAAQRPGTSVINSDARGKKQATRRGLRDRKDMMYNILKSPGQTSMSTVRNRS